MKVNFYKVCMKNKVKKLGEYFYWCSIFNPDLNENRIINKSELSIFCNWCNLKERELTKDIIFKMIKKGANL